MQPELQSMERVSSSGGHQLNEKVATKSLKNLVTLTAYSSSQKFYYFFISY